MPIVINVSSDVQAVMGRLTEDLKRQIPFATAFALTRTAKEAKLEVDRQLPKIFVDPTPFTLKAIGTTPANKLSLEASVFIKDRQARYLGIEIAGGVRHPKRRALVLPTGATVDEYGNIPRGLVKRLLRRSDTFSGTVRGIPGIWRRVRQGVILLIAYQGVAHYRPRFDFAGIVRGVVLKQIRPNLEGALALAIRTAR